MASLAQEEQPVEEEQRLPQRREQRAQHKVDGDAPPLLEHRRARGVELAPLVVAERWEPQPPQRGVDVLIKRESAAVLHHADARAPLGAAALLQHPLERGAAALPAQRLLGAAAAARGRRRRKPLGVGLEVMARHLSQVKPHRHPQPRHPRAHRVAR